MFPQVLANTPLVIVKLWGHYMLNGGSEATSKCLTWLQVLTVL